jgi:DNA (cytosine-5)-methyltransferase 1
MNIIDLFSGCGGLSLGFKWAGFKTVLAVDNFKDANETLTKNLGHDTSDQTLSSDSGKIIKAMLGNSNIDGIIGGPPCQGFSTVGTMDINDPRNSLYLAFKSVVEEYRPRFFLIENVANILKMGRGQFARGIVSELSELGYNVSKPAILNSADYGVPQNRKRAFFIGVRDGWYDYPDASYSYVSTKDALDDLPLVKYGFSGTSPVEYRTDPKNNFQMMMRNDSKMVYNHNYTNHTSQTQKIISMIPDGGKITDIDPKYWKIRNYNKAFQRMNSKEPSHTIDTGHRNYFHYSENRIPSVRECARIQSFPDNYIFYGSKTSQYRQIGNAVPPILAKNIAENLHPNSISAINKYNINEQLEFQLNEK